MSIDRLEELRQERSYLQNSISRYMLPYDSIPVMAFSRKFELRKKIKEAKKAIDEIQREIDEHKKDR